MFSSPIDWDKHLGDKVPTRAIERAAALGLMPPGFSTYDLRRTCRTRWAKLGISETVTKKILGHKLPRSDVTAAVYDQHDYQDEMLAALERWEAHLLAITAPREKAPAALTEDAGELPAAAAGA